MGIKHGFSCGHMRILVVFVDEINVCPSGLRGSSVLDLTAACGDFQEVITAPFVHAHFSLHSDHLDMKLKQAFCFSGPRGSSVLSETWTTIRVE